MKTFISIFKNRILILLFIGCFSNIYTQNDYLKSATSTGSGITTNNSNDWTDLTSVSIDVTNVSNILVTASLNMRPDGSSIKGREANYRIYRTLLPTDNSGVIKRQIVRNSETGVESWGIGTLVHIFDVSSLSGTISFTLEHSNQGQQENGRNIFTSARLSTIALTTAINAFELSNDVKRLTSDVSTTSASFEAISGLETNNIDLPNDGDIFVIASINSRSNGNNIVGEYKLEYSANGGLNWFDLGQPVKRTMINNFDNGIISLVGLLREQTAGTNYKFRLVHRRISGNTRIITSDVNLVAIALNHIGGGYFPSFYSEVGSVGIDITGVSALPQEVTSTSFLSASDIGAEEPDLFVSAQFLMSASNLDTSVNPDQRMRGSNQLFLNNGTEITESEYYRYIPDNSNFGSGGTIGLAENIDENSTYTIGMKHHVAFVSNPDATENETLTTSEVILTGFQTFDESFTALGLNEVFETSDFHIYSKEGAIVVRRETYENATIRIVNLLGQTLISESLGNKNETSFNLNYNGIIVVSIKTENQVVTKKIVL